jgi:hypothetical protein
VSGFEFCTDGPHSPEYTRQLGEALAEAVRCLNYASRDGAPGLEYPGDVYSLLGWLYTAAERLPQLLDQLAYFLHEQYASGRVADDQGRDASTLTAIAGGALLTGKGHAEALTSSLRKAQEQIAGLYVKENDNA